MLSSMKPDAAEKKPQRPSMTERIKHRRSQAGEDRAPREPVGRVRNTGTRRVHKRLRVAQWVDPPVKIAVSQAAILFDVAYAAALTHHAFLISHSRTADAFSEGVAMYLVTAAPVVWQWWTISLFLCRYDSGDLVNEFILVIYMVMVLGQSITIQNCGLCVLSRNKVTPCALEQDPVSLLLLDKQQCTSSSTYGEGVDVWPELPFQCWVYVGLTIAPRVVHLLNMLRAVAVIQPRGRRDAVLQAAELAGVLPLWGIALAFNSVAPTAVTFVIAAILELIFIVVEPAHRLYNRLVRSGKVSTQLDTIPIDIDYVERRWHRLLMISLATVPAFSTSKVTFGFVAVSSWFMIVSCAVSYIIKLFYFDVTDDHLATEESHRRGLSAVHALDHQKEKRWRATAWILTHVILIVLVCAEGVGINQLIDPWAGYPEDTQGNVVRDRFLIAAPMTGILWTLCIQHTLHVGSGSGLRRIGRSRRLTCRAVVGLLILLLPLLSYTGDDGGEDPNGVEARCRPAPPSLPPAPSPDTPVAPPAAPFSPKWLAFPRLASRTVFLSCFFLLLLFQLCLELYGRHFIGNEAPSNLTQGPRTLRVGDADVQTLSLDIGGASLDGDGAAAAGGGLSFASDVSSGAATGRRSLLKGALRSNAGGDQGHLETTMEMYARDL